MMEIKTGTWNPAGRSMGWRLAMVWAGLLVGGLGVVIVVWPDVIAYAIGGGMILIGVVIILSALMARGPGARQRGWTQAEDGDVTVVVEPDEAQDAP